MHRLVSWHRCSYADCSPFMLCKARAAPADNPDNLGGSVYRTQHKLRKKEREVIAVGTGKHCCAKDDPQEKVPIFLSLAVTMTR